MSSSDPITAAANTVPGSASQVRIVTKYTFQNYLRSRRFVVMTSIITIIGVAVTAVLAYTRSQAFLSSNRAFYGGFWGTFVNLIAVLTVVFFAGDAISGEFQNRTGYFLVPNPIRRSAIYVGKFLAAFIASAILLGLFTAFTLANGVYYFGTSVPAEFWQSLLFAYIGVLTALAFVFMISSFFKTSAYSILISVILIILVFNIVDTLSATLLGIEPWFSLTYGEGIISSILMAQYPPHFMKVPAGPNFQISVYTATVPEGLTIMAAYFIFSAIVGLILFERKEFT